MPLAPPVISYLATEMIVHSGSSDQSSIQLLIRTASGHQGMRVWVLRKSLVLQIIDSGDTKAITLYDPTSPALNPENRSIIIYSFTGRIQCTDGQLLS